MKPSYLYQNSIQCFITSLVSVPSSCVRSTPRMYPRSGYFLVITIVILFSKLIPLLRDHGIHNLDNRKEWPLSVMRQVLFELMEETPKDLLSMNLYLSSKTADEWYQLTSNLTRSIAVMCVIGYIIGKINF